MASSSFFFLASASFFSFSLRFFSSAFFFSSSFFFSSAFFFSSSFFCSSACASRLGFFRLARFLGLLCLFGLLLLLGLLQLLRRGAGRRLRRQGGKLLGDGIGLGRLGGLGLGGLRLLLGRLGRLCFLDGGGGSAAGGGPSIGLGFSASFLETSGLGSSLGLASSSLESSEPCLRRSSSEGVIIATVIDFGLRGMELGRGEDMQIRPEEDRCMDGD